MKRTSFLIMLFVLTLLQGCAKSSSSTSSSTGGTPVTGAQIAGTHYAACEIIGTGNYGSAFNGDSILRSLTLDSSGGFSLTTFFYTGTVCQAGGTELFVYETTGTYVLGTLATTPTTATQITYTTASSQITVYAGSGAGSTIATDMNSDCPGFSPAFNTSGTSSSSTAGGHTCNSGPLALPEFQPAGTVFHDLIQLDSNTSPTTVSVANANNVFMMGQFASSPTSVGFTYAF